MVRLLALATLALLGTIAVVMAVVTWSDAPPAAEIHVEIAGERFALPRGLLRDPRSAQEGAAGRVDLMVAFPDFQPIVRENAQRQTPDIIQIALQPREGEAAPETRPAQLYAKFLTPEVWSNPGGLVMRRFRPGSPYEDEELYLALPDERLFSARCPNAPIDADTLEEACLWQFRHGALDVLVRFPARHLVAWRTLRDSTMALLTAIRDDRATHQSRSDSKIAISKK